MNTHLINRKAVKELALEVCKTSHNGQFTRVGKEFLERINAKFEELVKTEIQATTSDGKTLK